MNGYVCFYNSHRVEIYAETPYAAQLKCAEQLKVPPKKRYMISVILAELNGKQVTHVADF